MSYKDLFSLQDRGVVITGGLGYLGSEIRGGGTRLRG